MERANQELAREISERQRVEEALQNASDPLRAVLDAVPTWVSWVSSDLKYLGVNRHLASVLQVPPEDFVGKDIGFLGVSPTFTECVRRFFASPSLNAAQEVTADVRSTARSFLVVAQKYHHGEAAVFAGIDIFDLKRTEAALHNAKEAAEAANRAKSGFLATMKG